MKIFGIIFMAFFSAFLLAQSGGNNLFNPAINHTLKINFYKAADWDTIKAKYSFDRDSLTYVPVKLEIDNIVYDSVGLAIKGNTYINEDTNFLQYPFKVDMNEFKDGQKHDKIKKFNLNMKNLDNNIIMNNLFATYKVPYLRTAKTQVYIKGILAGEYLIVEQVDNTYLKRIFLNNDGNLYKGDRQADLQWLGTNQSDYEYKYSLKTNETANDYSGLINFINILNNSLDDSTFVDSLTAVFDFPSYFKILALQVLMGKHDDYFDKNHNYYLYHNPVNGKISFIPYDNDDITGMHHQLFIDEGRLGSLPLIATIKNNSILRREYLKSFCEIMPDLKDAIPPIGAKYNIGYTNYTTYAEESITLSRQEISSLNFDCNATSVNDLQNQTKIWFSKNTLYIKNIAHNGILEVKTLHGQLVFQKKLNGKQESSFHLSFLKPTVYIVSYIDRAKFQTIKVVVEK